ncbi:MAG: prolipoprotein diacylglyceryl transferase [Planctomycetaceae bacterium]
MHVGFPDFFPTYAVPVLVAVLLGVLYPVARHITDRRQRRQYFVLQLVTFLSAVLGAKLMFLFGEYGWPFRPVHDWESILYSGRSIIGALIFGLLGAELTKPLVNYPLPPNDRFAAVLPFTFAIGRVGCWMSGCCRGAPCSGLFAITGVDGVSRHPAQLYEILFQLLAGSIGIVLVKRKRFQGSVFSLYLVAYGAFRLWAETIRETPQSFGGLTTYQWASLLMIGLGAGFLWKRTCYPSEAWKNHFANPPLTVQP